MTDENYLESIGSSGPGRRTVVGGSCRRYDRVNLNLRFRLVTALVALFLSHLAEARIFVSAGDPTCGGQAPCFSTIQAGVNAAGPGEEVSVAVGTYTGVTAVDLSGDVYHQVVMITESIVLRGGYTEGDWSTPDPASNVTIIDAENAGRGITVVGDASDAVTVAGFSIINGDYSDLGNADGEFNVCRRTSSDCAGGLLARFVQIHIEDCIFENNIAGTTSSFSDGGGAVLWGTADGSAVRRTRFIGNQAPSFGASGGGLWLTDVGDTTIFESDFDDNLAGQQGGGFGGAEPFGIVTVNRVILFRNDADGIGGGGGFWFLITREGSALEVDQVAMSENEANTFGSAVHIEKFGSTSSSVTLDNMHLLFNGSELASDLSSVVSLQGVFGHLDATVRHLTVVDHADAAAFRVATSGAATVDLDVVNTLIEFSDSGFRANEGGGEVSIEHTNTWSYDVTTLEVIDAGTPTITGIGSLSGDPLLESDGFLTAGSPAIDAGVDSGLTHDFFGNPRPAGPGFDIGAQEYVLIFEDGFESGDATAWTSTVP